jgi:hypothetical protein
MNDLANRVAILVVLVLPVVVVPLQYGLPLNAMTLLAAVVWIGVIALTLSGWPRASR